MPVSCCVRLRPPPTGFQGSFWIEADNVRPAALANIVSNRLHPHSLACRILYDDGDHEAWHSLTAAPCSHHDAHSSFRQGKTVGQKWQSPYAVRRCARLSGACSIAGWHPDHPDGRAWKPWSRDSNSDRSLVQAGRVQRIPIISVVFSLAKQGLE